ALGQLGEEGWELVTVYDKASNWLNGMEKGFALFKRPVPEDAEPDGPWAAAYIVAGTGSQPLGPAGASSALLQRALDERGIAAPGASEALAGQVGEPLNGVARVTCGDRTGVVAVAGAAAAAWWGDGYDVDVFNLSDFEVAVHDGA